MPLENLGPIGQRSLLVGLANLNQGYELVRKAVLCY